MGNQADSRILEQVKEVEEAEQNHIDGKILAHALKMAFFCGIARKDIAALKCGSIRSREGTPSFIVIDKDTIPLNAEISQATSAYFQYLRSKGYDTGADDSLFPGYEGANGEKKFYRHLRTSAIRFEELRKAGIDRTFTEFRKVGLSEQQSAEKTGKIFRMKPRSVLQSIQGTQQPAKHKSNNEKSEDKDILDLYHDLEKHDIIDIIDDKAQKELEQFIILARDSKYNEVTQGELILGYLKHLDMRLKAIEINLAKWRTTNQGDKRGKPINLNEILPFLSDAAPPVPLSPKKKVLSIKELSSSGGIPELGADYAEHLAVNINTLTGDIIRRIKMLKKTVTSAEYKTLIDHREKTKIMKEQIKTDNTSRASHKRKLRISFTESRKTPRPYASRGRSIIITHNQNILSDAVTLIFHTGLLPNEIAGLTIKDIIKPDKLKELLSDTPGKISPDAIVDEIQPVSGLYSRSYQKLSVILTDESRLLIADHLQYIRENCAPYFDERHPLFPEIKKGKKAGKIVQAIDQAKAKRKRRGYYTPTSILTKLRGINTYKSYNALRNDGIRAFCNKLRKEGLQDHIIIERLQRHARYSNIQKAKAVFKMFNKEPDK